MPLKDVIGQDNAIKSIVAGLSPDRTAHAYLFLGPNGVGKHKAAKEFAKLLNCGIAPDDNCGVCKSCIMVENAVHPNVFFIKRQQDKKNISIDAIRLLQARLSLRPFQEKLNIAIIDAQEMAEEASNSLLKILEEPPLHTIFILIASNRRALPETIVSRCHIIRFKPLSIPDFMHILKKDFGIREEEALLLSHLSGRNVSKALSLKDEGVLACKNSIIDNFLSNDIRDISQDIISSNGVFTNEEVCDILSGFYRDILVYKYIKDNSLLINQDRIGDIELAAQGLAGMDTISRMGYIEEAKHAFSANANTKLTFNLLKEKLAT
jgi:DNA polymerase III subunit delta'